MSVCPTVRQTDWIRSMRNERRGNNGGFLSARASEVELLPIFGSECDDYSFNDVVRDEGLKTRTANPNSLCTPTLPELCTTRKGGGGGYGEPRGKAQFFIGGQLFLDGVEDGGSVNLSCIGLTRFGRDYNSSLSSCHKYWAGN